jgi:hypothetical protein
MANVLDDLATNLSFVLKEKIHVENDCIVLGGSEPSDYAFLQIGANDGELYLSAPIIEINEINELAGDHLSILMELNGDTKNYPHGRIAYNSIASAAQWVEKLDQALSAQQIIDLVQARGQLIAQIRFALQSTEKA